MASVAELLEKIFTLTSNVESLTKDIERLIRWCLIITSV